MAAITKSLGSISKETDWNFPYFNLLPKPIAKSKLTEPTEPTEPTEFVRGYVDGDLHSDNVRRVLEIFDDRQCTTFTKW